MKLSFSKSLKISLRCSFIKFLNLNSMSLITNELF